MTTTPSSHARTGRRVPAWLTQRLRSRRIESAAQPTAGTAAPRPATTRDPTGRYVAADETRRFLANVDGGPDCWLWTGRVDRDGYPVFKVRRAGRWIYVRAHRWAWEAEHGPIPVGLTLDHRCHTLDPDCPGGRDCAHRRCVRPDHLDAVTAAENRRRAHARRTTKETT